MQIKLHIHWHKFSHWGYEENVFMRAIFFFAPSWMTYDTFRVYECRCGHTKRVKH
jgi:hypothetical protein